MRSTFNTKEYTVAIEGWATICGNYSAIESLIPTNYVFNLTADQIKWLDEKNKNSKFCVEMGIYYDQVVIILSPLDASGQKIIVDEYCYAVLEKLTQDLRLVETEEYVVVKNAILSKELRNVDNSSNISYPVSNQPMLEQDKALSAIESWRNEAMTWFYRECQEFKGANIFRKFFVPAVDLLPSKDGFSNVVCSFGLKFSDVYQKMLPTLIFISFYGNVNNSEENGSIEKTSNTYDWSQPCPPLCPIM